MTSNVKGFVRGDIPVVLGACDANISGERLKGIRPNWLIQTE
jgi:hypothetical protein